jgi:hypothetical protein
MERCSSERPYGTPYPLSLQNAINDLVSPPDKRSVAIACKLLAGFAEKPLHE